MQFPELANEYSDIKEHHLRILEALALRPILTPELTMEEVCQEHGLTRSSIYELKKRNPRAIEYQNRVAELFLQDSQVEANQKLMELLRSDNQNVSLKALELFYKVTGRLQQTPTTNLLIDNRNNGKDEKVILNEIEALEQRLNEN